MRLLLKTLKALILLIIIIFCGTGALLKLGIHLDSIAIGPARLNDISLAWKQKLELEINSITVNPISEIKISETTTEIDLPRNFKNVSYLSRLFSEIIIQDITYDEYTAQLHYAENQEQKSFFQVNSKNLQLSSDIFFSNQSITVDVTNLSSNAYKVDATGQFIFELATREAKGEFTANIADSLPIRLSFSADMEGITFEGTETGVINSIKPVVDLFDIDKDVLPWITESLSGDRYRLKSFQGYLPWDNPLEILNSLQAEIRIDKCAYVFATGFNPITTEYTDVVFEHGVLIIQPHKPFFYGQDAKKSWLDIDFNNPDDIVLTAYIKAPAVLNDDILRLFAFYDIELPFKQVKGTTDTNLTLKVHLNDEIVEATGTFIPTESLVEYDGQIFKIGSGLITLKDTVVTLQQLDVAIEDFLAATVKGVYDGEKSTGELNIAIEKAYFEIDNFPVTLQNDAPKPTINVKLNPEGDRYEISSTSVTTAGFDFLIAPFEGPFSAVDFSAGIPPTLVISPQGIQAEVSGSFSIEKEKTDLLCNLLFYEMNDLSLVSPERLPLVVQYDQQLTIRSLEPSSWAYESATIELNAARLNYDGTDLSVSTDMIRYDKLLSAGLSGMYNFESRQGELVLNEVEALGDTFGEIRGSITSRPQSQLINFHQFGLLIDLKYAQEPSWTVTIKDLAPLHDRSQLLQSYQIASGSVSASSSKEEKGKYTFSASLPYGTPLIFKSNTPVEHFTIQGDSDGETIRAIVNDDIYVYYKNSQLAVTADNTTFNFIEINNLIQRLTLDDEDTSSSASDLSFTLDAKNSSLFFTENNVAIADSIHFEFADSKSLLKLLHGSGRFVMKTNGDSFSLEGKKLNDAFMGALFQNSTFIGGHMSMVALGTFDHFSWLVKVRDTLLKDHRAFNNVMGFLNTVPALVTFSMPEYNTKGVYLDSLIAGAVVKEGVATFESLELKSPLFDMTGTGWADLPNQTVDMEINLITQAKTNIQKIPLIGYIIAGEEKHPSITLEVTGDLKDPKVDNPIFREVATMPFSMLYRTLKLPIDLVEKLGE